MYACRGGTALDEKRGSSCNKKLARLFKVTRCSNKPSIDRRAVRVRVLDMAHYVRMSSGEKSAEFFRRYKDHVREAHEVGACGTD